MKKSAQTLSPAPAKKAAVPMLDLARQYTNIRQEIDTAIQEVCLSQQYILGKEVTEFEKEAAAYLGAKEAIGCASGTDALWLALVAAGVGPGDEVFTTPFSFFATASSIARTGAKPVFVDVDPETLNIDPGAIESRINRSHSARTKAIMPVHLFGQCANMDELKRTAAQNKLAVVEDAAQAFGASWRGRRAGDLAPLAAFSFYPTKNLSCYGDGGLVTCDSANTADHVRRLRNHGSRRRYYHEELGWNSRLDSMQAAILRVKLRYIDDWDAARAKRAGAYDLLLKSAGLLGTKSKPGIVRPLGRNAQANHIYHQYVVRVPKRDELR
ncbi:MAG TPA: DegT/DnrJ/EryC1/StrS family aminotransferase, partial [Terriglobales bacterium]|nr:DegT/DnrJ/EryC1/StrS family aminotransferase [Terriglobales bacterium]